ncbi:MAG: hypothetical protein QOF19_1739 [Alphaproteobacteria bacterium]|jgi:hypothetical protein|nr:hypothetical protein [Alphaproteobacteria bacterium]
MGYNDLTNLDRDPKLANALGNMVVAWAYAESSLCCTMARVSGMNINMALMGFYRIPTFEARRKFIQALILEWKPGKFDKTAIAKEVDSISDLSSTRNDWIHGVWCFNETKPDESVIFDFRRPDGKGRRKEVKAPDVQNHVNAVISHSKTLNRLIDRADLRGDE